MDLILFVFIAKIIDPILWVTAILTGILAKKKKAYIICAALYVAFSEVVLYTTQYTRTIEDSLVSVPASIIVCSMIFSLAYYLTPFRKK